MLSTLLLLHEVDFSQVHVCGSMPIIHSTSSKMLCSDPIRRGKATAGFCGFNPKLISSATSGIHTKPMRNNWVLSPNPLHPNALDGCQNVPTTISRYECQISKIKFWELITPTVKHVALPHAYSTSHSPRFNWRVTCRKLYSTCIGYSACAL